ncbi:MAG: dihydrofolate reductase family protein [Patescibacteria group bacterium]|nr:dihydrofolate reductase family protein [Patescibacteria group bacterium]
MKTILWMGISLNGFIARENNEEDFISDNCWLLWVNSLKETGCVIFGRKTYENLLTWDKKYINDLNGIKIIVVSGNPNFVIGKNVELAKSPQEALGKLNKEGFKNVVLTGGSTLNSSFAKLNLIDEVVLNVEPIIVGKGIALFHPDQFDLKLKFLDIKKSEGKTIQLHYKVVK